MSVQKLVDLFFGDDVMVVNSYSDIPDWVPEDMRDHMMKLIDNGMAAIMPKKNPFEQKDDDIFEDLAAKLLTDSQGERSSFKDIFEEAFGMSPSILEELSRRSMEAGCKCPSCQRRRIKEMSPILSDENEVRVEEFRERLELSEIDREALDILVKTMAKARVESGIQIPKILILTQIGDDYIETTANEV